MFVHKLNVALLVPNRLYSRKFFFLGTKESRFDKLLRPLVAIPLLQVVDNADVELLNFVGAFVAMAF
jgi:hypothetical protein